MPHGRKQNYRYLANLTRPVLDAGRNFIDACITTPSIDRLGARPRFMPAGTTDYINGLFERAKELWERHWSKDFYLHDRNIGTLATAVTYVTLAAEVVEDMMGIIWRSRLYHPETLTSDERRLVNLEGTLLKFMSQMIRELEREPTKESDNVDPASLTAYIYFRTADQLAEFRVSRLAYAHQLANVAANVVGFDRNWLFDGPVYFHPDRVKWKKTWEHVVDVYSKSLKSATDKLEAAQSSSSNSLANLFGNVSTVLELRRRRSLLNEIRSDARRRRWDYRLAYGFDDRSDFQALDDKAKAEIVPSDFYDQLPSDESDVA